MSEHLSPGMGTTPPMKFMDLKEFREVGYLQELNRTCFHPLGLALVLSQEADGTYRFEGIWDARDDPEGIVFESLVDPEEIARAERFGMIVDQAVLERERRLGWVVQPIGDVRPREEGQ